MKLYNYHTHSFYCDGSSEPENYVKQAIDCGFASIGFSGHAPLPFKNDFAIEQNKMQAYCNDIQSLKVAYKNKINIHLGLEIDYIPSISQDFKQLKKQYGLEYIIGSVHLVRNKQKQGLWFIDGSQIKTYDQGLAELFDGDIQKAVTTYYAQICKMVKTEKPDIIGHLDKIKMNNKNRFFTEDEQWYKKVVEETLKAIASTKCIVEVNTRGLYKKRSEDFYPSVDILKKCYKLKIPVTVSSDAHIPTELNLYLKEALSVLKEIGFKKISVLGEKGWREEKI